MKPISNKLENLNLAADFPALVERCIQSFSRAPERDLHILRRRYGLDGGPINTLEELSACHDITRERVRQIQAGRVDRIRRMLEGKAKGRKLRVDSALQRRFVALREELREAGPVLSRSRFQRVVRTRFAHGVTGHWFALFAELIGYRLLEPGSSVGFAQGLEERWIEPDSLSQKTVDRIFECLKELGDRPEGVSVSTMLNELRNKGWSSPSEAVLRGVVAACPRLEIARGEIIRVRTEWLSSATDQAWRVLVSSRKPLSRDEVARRINKVRVGKRDLEPMSVEGVAARMSGDERFACRGKSGLWGLVEWDTVHDITIVEAMQKALHAAGEPLSIHALTRATLKLRPDASPKSVRSYIQQRSDLFTGANRERIALTSWGLKADSPKQKPRVRCSNDDFLAAVELARGERNSMPLIELIEHVMDLTGISSVTARQRLNQLEGLNMESRPGRKGKVVYFVAEIRPKSKARTVTKRAQIQKTIRAMIDEEGIVINRKKDLYEKVNRRTPCEPSTFYRYLSEIPVNEQPARRSQTPSPGLQVPQSEND